MAAYEGISVVSLSPVLMKYSKTPIAYFIKIGGPMSYVILKYLKQISLIYPEYAILNYPILILILSNIYFVFVGYIIITAINRI
jgi:hypothetical protein